MSEVVIGDPNSKSEKWMDKLESFFSLSSSKKVLRDPQVETFNQKWSQLQKRINGLTEFPKLKTFQQECQSTAQQAMNLPANEGIQRLLEVELEIGSKIEEHRKELLANQKLAEAETKFKDSAKIVLRSLQDLARLPGAVVEKARGLYEQAYTAAEAGTVEGYLTKGGGLLNQAANEIREQTRVAMIAIEEAKRQAGKKPDYEKKLLEAQIVMGKIMALPAIGVTPMFKKLQLRIEAGQAEAGKGQYANALAALGNFSDVKIENFEKQSETLVKGLSKMPEASEAEAALRDLRPIESPIEWKLDRQAVDGRLSALLDSGDKDKSPLVKALGELAGTLAKKVVERKALSLEAGKLIKELSTAMGSLKEAASPEQASAEQMEYEGLALLRGTGQFENFLSLGKPLLGRVQRLVEELKAEALEWEKNKAEAAGYYDKLQAFVPEARPTPPDFVLSEARSLEWLVHPKLTLELTKQKDWTRLHANLSQVRERFPILPVQFEAFRNFQGARDIADEQIQEKLKATREALDKATVELKKVISEEAAKDLQELAPFDTELKMLTTIWSGTLAKAFDAGTLKKDDMDSRLDDLRNRIDAAGAGDGLNKLAGDATGREQGGVFQASYAEFEKTLEVLRGIGPSTALELKARGEKIQAAGAEDWGKAAGELAELHKEATSQIEAIKLTRETLEKVVAKHKDILNRDLKEVVEDGSSNLKKAGKALNAEAVLLFAQVKSENLAAAMSALGEIERLMARMRKLHAEHKGGSGAVSGMSVEEIAERVKRVDERWDIVRKDMQTYTDKREKELKKEWDKLKAAVLTMSPEGAMGRLVDFGRSLNMAAESAARVKELDGQVTGNVKLATVKLKILANRETKQVKYLKTLTERLEGAEKLAKDKAQLYAAQSRLEDLLAELETGLGSVTAVLQKAGELEGREKAAEEADKAWGPAKEQMKLKIAEVETLVKAQGGDMGRVTELKKMLAQAEKTAGDDRILNKVGIKNDGDRATALRELQIAGERARQIIADPVGPTIGSRKELPKDVENYKANVRALLSVVNGLPAQIKSVLPEVPSQVVQKLTTLLQGATKGIPLHAFDVVVAKMTGDGITPAQQREQREIALGQVRLVRDTLNGHPQLQALKQSPVETGAVSGAFQRLLQALTRLEANLSRSCR